MHPSWVQIPVSANSAPATDKHPQILKLQLVNPQTFNYCPLCGTKTTNQMKEGEKRDYCPEHNEIIYKDSIPWAGTVVLDNEKILMVKRANEPSKHKWSVPAGFLDLGEHPRKAAIRELEEETKIQVEPNQVSLLQNIAHTHPDGTETFGIIYGVHETYTSGEPEPRDDALKAEFTRPETKNLATVAQKMDYNLVGKAISQKIDVAKHP